jgi:hypothetical protein
VFRPTLWLSALLLVALLGSVGPARAQTGGWLSAPPGSGLPFCPAPGQWVLLYWGGQPAPISTAATVCSDAERFWVSRSAGWLGYNARLPQASDTWTVQTGEAHFVRGSSLSGAVPTQPAALADYPAAIASHLSAGGDREPCLESLLAAWRTAQPQTEFPGHQCLSADVNADGRRDYAAAINLPPARLGLEGESLLAIFTNDATGYRAAHVILGEEAGDLNVRLPRVTLQQAEDINRDGIVEVFYTTTFCGAHTCYTTPQFLRWNGQTFVELLGEDASMPYPDRIALEDRDGDGVKELVMHGGTIGSAGAGVQRASTWVYTWDGSRYLRSATVYDPSPYLYFAIIDGDAALAGGRYEDAIAHFRRAIEDQTLKDWNAEVSRGRPADRVELTPYAGFHLALAYIASGRDRLLALTTLNAAIANHPGTRHAEAAAIFRDAWPPGTTPRAACAPVIAYARANLEAFRLIWDYGYANPEFTPEQLCPL